jgi:hypothetical protein
MISTGADGCPRHNNNSFCMPTATLQSDSTFPMSRASVLNCSNLHPISRRNYYHPFSHITMLPSNDSSSPLRRQDESSRRCIIAATARRSVTSSSASRRTTTPSIDTKHKPWLDPQRILSARVEALVDSPWIHPAEFRVDSDLHELLLECCRLQSIQGQQMAQEIMERLLWEKTRLNNQQKEEEGESAAAAVVYIPERFWQNLIFGWSKLAGKLRVARLHMQENLQSAIEAAKEDYRRDQDSRTSAGQSTDDEADYEYDLSSDRNSSSEPTVELFNTFLLGLARAAKISPGAAMQAESTHFDMMEYHERFGWHTKPNTRSYTHVINAHVNSRHKASGGRALDILNHVKQMHETERQAYLDRVGIAYHERGPNHPRIVTPDGIMYTSVMMAMLNSMSSRKVVELLHEFLDWAKKNNIDGGDETIQVDASHFTVPIRALGNEIERSNNAAVRVRLAKKAESILNLMFEYMAQRKQMVALSDNEDKQVREEEEDVQFGKALYAFNACLDAWGRAHAQEAALRCEDLLKKMLDKSINTTNDSASNENNNVANSADIVVVVEPDTVSFNACLQAWSKAHSFYPDAAYRANDLLDLFCQLHTSGLVKKGPDLQSWTITILALQHVTPSKSSGDKSSNDSSNASSPPPSSRASIVRRARRLLEEMLDSVQSQSTQISRNLSGPFTAVIRVAAKMAEVDSTLAADRAKESTVDGKDAAAAAAVDSLLFGENVDHEERNCEEGDEDPYSIACRTYREAVDDLYNLKDRQRTKNRVDQNHSNNNDRDDDSSSSHSNLSMGDSMGSDTRSGIADHHTFAAMLTCIDKYNPHPTSSERKAFGDAVFADACQAGQVSRVVLHEAAVVLQLPAAVDVVSTSRDGKNEIPLFWYRNVEGSWRPK